MGLEPIALHGQMFSKIQCGVFFFVFAFFLGKNLGEISCSLLLVSFTSWFSLNIKSLHHFCFCWIKLKASEFKSITLI